MTFDHRLARIERVGISSTKTSGVGDERDERKANAERSQDDVKAKADRHLVSSGEQIRLRYGHQQV